MDLANGSFRFLKGHCQRGNSEEGDTNNDGTKMNKIIEEVNTPKVGFYDKRLIQVERLSFQGFMGIPNVEMNDSVLSALYAGLAAGVG